MRNFVLAYRWSVRIAGEYDYDDSSSDESVYSYGPAHGVVHGLEHVSLFVFGQVYEYSALGIRITRLSSKSEVKSQCHVSSRPKDVKSLGETKISPVEFNTWVKESSKEFSPETFDMTERNCITWATAAAQKLGVAPDPKWSSVQQVSKRRKSSFQDLPYTCPGPVARNDLIGSSAVWQQHPPLAPRTCCAHV